MIPRFSVEDMAEDLRRSSLYGSKEALMWSLSSRSSLGRGGRKESRIRRRYQLHRIYVLAKA